MLTVGIIEDHQVLIDALVMLLRTEAEMQFAGSAGTCSGGADLVRRTCPDVLLLDVGLPDGDGLDLIPQVKQFSPKTQVVVLTCLSDEKTLMRAIDKGVNGFVSKSGSLNDLLFAIRKAADGEIVMPPSLLLGLLNRIPRGKTVNYSEEQIWEDLTIREREILERLARGKSGTSIAAELNIAPLTVRTHVRNIMAKLGVHSRLEAVSFGLRNGLIDPPN